MNFETMMEKEIFEQPDVVRGLINDYFDEDFGIASNIKKVKLIASGSSYHCALLGVQLFQKYTKLDATSFYSGEFMLNENVYFDEDTLCIFISQSGETYDTLDCLNMVKKTKAKTLCITNCENSTLYNLCDYKIVSTAGKEESIASTKALTAQIFCLALLALRFEGNECEEELNNLKTLPEKIEEILSRQSEFDKIVNILKKNKSVVLLGSKECYALAKEGALKIKETSYVNTAAYPMGEFLHGHVAVLNNQIPVISSLTPDNYYSQLKVIKKIRDDYNPFLITIGTKKTDSDIKNLSNITFDIDYEDYLTRIFLILIVYQVLAFKNATALKMNVDKPRGLSKVVK